MRIMDASIAIGLVAGVLVATMLGFTGKKEEAACVGIFYDQAVNSGDSTGKKDSESLQKLLRGIMPLSQVVTPIEGYQAGDLEKCQVNFYLGSHSENKLPRAFLYDFVTTDRKVVWLGYNIWQLGEQLEKNLGLRFIRLTTMDTIFLSQGAKAMYFSEVLYKGRVYLKAPGVFEQVELLPTNLEKFDALAESRHPGTREVIPYIVRSQNRYYVADAPKVLGESPVFKELLAELR